MKALHIESHTLIGPDSELPASYGNCFSIIAEDGNRYAVVNFIYENIKALEKSGLTWPLEIEPLSKWIAVLMDPRIGERWYQDRYCEVCTPASLLPIVQRQRHQRDIARGRRVEEDGCVMFRLDTPEVEFP
jgi:hypothetical protein